MWVLAVSEQEASSMPRPSCSRPHHSRGKFSFPCHNRRRRRPCPRHLWLLAAASAHKGTPATVIPATLQSGAMVPATHQSGAVRWHSHPTLLGGHFKQDGHKVSATAFQKGHLSFFFSCLSCHFVLALTLFLTFSLLLQFRTGAIPGELRSRREHPVGLLSERVLPLLLFCRPAVTFN